MADTAPLTPGELNNIRSNNDSVGYLMFTQARMLFCHISAQEAEIAALRARIAELERDVERRKTVYWADEWDMQDMGA